MVSALTVMFPDRTRDIGEFIIGKLVEQLDASGADDPAVDVT